MIRFLAVLLLLCNLCLPLVSCTSSPENEDDVSSAAPIEDSELNGDGPAQKPDASAAADDELANEIADGGAAPADQPVGDAGLEDKPKTDDLDAEFDKAPEEPVAQGAAEENLENELAGGDDLDKPIEGKKEDMGDEMPAADIPVAAVATEKPKIRDIRYMSNQNGGTVVIEATKPVTYQTRMNSTTQQFVIEIANVELPQALQRPFPTKDFNSRIGSINAYQPAGSDTARVVIQLNGKMEGEPVVQQEGTSLVVIPPATAAPQVATKEQPANPQTAESINAAAGALQARTLDEFLTGNQKFFGRMISLQVKDADVRDIVNFLAEESGANIVMSDDVRGKISLKLRRVPWDQALVTVMRTKELGYVRQGNVLRISTLKSLQSETEAANRIIEAGKALVPAVVQVIPVSYAAMDDIIKNLTPFLSKDGKIVADQRTNTLIVTDKAEVVERVQKIVKTLDIPPAQVSIESKIVEAAEDFESFMGINWGFNGADVPLSSSGGAQGAPVNLNLIAHSAALSRDFAGAGPFSTTLGIGTLDLFGDLTATLSLAEHDSLAKVISAPRISSMNREKSTILQKGENISIITTRSEQTGSVTKAEKRTPFSLELNVTPQITSDGGVIMDLEVKRDFLGPVVDAELGSRPVNTRSAKTKVLVHNGQTAVIGGIYTSDELEANQGIPGLMHIPILGWLFKNKTTTRTKNELLIFLTPRIIAQQEEARL